MDGLSWVRKQVEQADTDLLREMVKLFCDRVMGDHTSVDRRRRAPAQSSPPPVAGAPFVLAATHPGSGSSGQSVAEAQVHCKGADNFKDECLQNGCGLKLRKFMRDR